MAQQYACGGLTEVKFSDFLFATKPSPPRLRLMSFLQYAYLLKDSRLSLGEIVFAFYYIGKYVRSERLWLLRYRAQAS